MVWTYKNKTITTKNLITCLTYKSTLFQLETFENIIKIKLRNTNKKYIQLSLEPGILEHLSIQLPTKLYPCLESFTPEMHV
jgi:hypothetical protein